jgi:hypothetical protein
MHFRSLKDGLSMLNVVHLERAEREELRRLEEAGVELKADMFKSLCA